MNLRRACVEDLQAVEQLVLGAGLPLGGLADQFPSAFWVASHDAALVGCVGLERYEDWGLLRSLAVAHSWRRQAVGRRLVMRLLEEAHCHELAGVFLLTTTATDFFPRHGFTPAVRAEAPAAIRRSPEFASICPSAASCFVWHPTR